MTTARPGRRFFACAAALPPAASPPITTTRPLTPRTLGRRADRRRSAAPWRGAGLASVHDRASPTWTAAALAHAVPRGPRTAARTGSLPRARPDRPVGSPAVRTAARLTRPRWHT